MLRFEAKPSKILNASTQTKAHFCMKAKSGRLALSKLTYGGNNGAGKVLPHRKN